MDLITGEYKHIKSEHLIEYLLFLGLPKEKALQKCDTAVLNIYKQDNTIYVHSYCANIPYRTKFIVGQEIDEAVSPEKIIRSRTELSDNVMEITSRSSNMTIKRIFEFFEEKLVVTLINLKPGAPVAKRYYERIKTE